VFDGDGRRNRKGFGKKNNNRYSARAKRRRSQPFFLDEEYDQVAADNSTAIQAELVERVDRLECLVVKQAGEIKNLKDDNKKLIEATASFARVIQLLREAGLQTEETDAAIAASMSELSPRTEEEDNEEKKTDTHGEEDEDGAAELLDEAGSGIFGRAPSSVLDAADVAGASIMAAMLDGKQRMLVDVRDAQLSRDPETLVQFVELAILPVAAGLEGMESLRNRLKIVFPSVSQLLDYRRTMALAAPDVVALSLLGLDPIEEQDNFVVVIAPPPDDKEGVAAMNELLVPSDPAREPIQQPIVVLNCHTGKMQGPAADFEVAYHMRLLTVSHMSKDRAQEYLEQFGGNPPDGTAATTLASEYNATGVNNSSSFSIGGEITEPQDGQGNRTTLASADAVVDDDDDDDAALEAAMKHAHEVGKLQQHHAYDITGAIVIRAYPKPWHVFVDASASADADFEVAATFDEEPSLDSVNLAIRDFLMGSEQEDALVSQQMQQALEAGQLDKISEMLGGMGIDISKDGEEGDDDDDFYGEFGNYSEDSV